MIDYTVVRREIESYIDANFNTVPMKFENTLLASIDTEHITVEDGDLSRNRLDVSDPIVSQVEGTLIIGIFTQVGIGTERGREIASELDSLLVNYNSDIALSGSLLVSAGNVAESNLFRHNLSVPYTYVYGQTESNC